MLPPGVPLLPLRWPAGQLSVSEGHHLQPGGARLRLVVQRGLQCGQGPLRHQRIHLHSEINAANTASRSSTSILGYSGGWLGTLLISDTMSTTHFIQSIARLFEHLLGKWWCGRRRGKVIRVGHAQESCRHIWPVVNRPWPAFKTGSESIFFSVGWGLVRTCHTILLRLTVNLGKSRGKFDFTFTSWLFCNNLCHAIDFSEGFVQD